MIKVKTWDNREKVIDNLELRAELDGNNETFYKIEGRHIDERFMVGYYYQKGQALCIHMDLLEKLLDSQEREHKARQEKSS